MKRPEIKTDVPKLIVDVEAALKDVKKYRKSLIQAAPLEIVFYNIVTASMRELNGFLAQLEDANGTYLSKTEDEPRSA